MADTPEVNDELVERMMQPPDIRTRQQAVEAATRLAEKIEGQRAALDALWGIGWDGDYEEIKRARISKHGDWDLEHDAA